MLLQSDDLLYRRLHIEAFNRTDQRITSAAFKTAGEYDQRISVYIARLLDHQPQRVIKHRPHHGVAELAVGDATSLGFAVVHDPDASDATLGHAHALIIGPNNRASSKRLAQIARLVIAPPVRPS